MQRIEKDADGRFHFSECEYYATRQLFGAVSTFNDCYQELERRVREIIPMPSKERMPVPRADIWRRIWTNG